MYSPSSDVMVSVSIITYNQIDYIKDAIDSVLKQEVNFDYEVIIGDDSSTDGTREILKEYKNKYPDKIQLILHPRRYGDIPGRTNNITNIYACRGKYIALLDGDDFWISTDKLQRQVDFLESNPGYTMAAHQAKKVLDGQITEKTVTSDSDRSKTYTHADILHEPIAFASTSTFMLRNDVIHTFPGWFWNIISADYAIMLLWSEKGKLHFFNDIYTGYRKHDDSFMATDYYTLDSLKIKIKELQLYRKRFLPFFKRRNRSGFMSAIRSVHRLNQRISSVKRLYLIKLRKEKKILLFLKDLLLLSFSNYTFLYFLRSKIKKLKRRLE